MEKLRDRLIDEIEYSWGLYDSGDWEEFAAPLADRILSLLQDPEPMDAGGAHTIASEICHDVTHYGGGESESMAHYEDVVELIQQYTHKCREKDAEIEHLRKQKGELEESRDAVLAIIYGPNRPKLEIFRDIEQLLKDSKE